MIISINLQVNKIQTVQYKPRQVVVTRRQPVSAGTRNVIEICYRLINMLMLVRFTTAELK